MDIIHCYAVCRVRPFEVLAVYPQGVVDSYERESSWLATPPAVAATVHPLEDGYLRLRTTFLCSDERTGDGQDFRDQEGRPSSEHENLRDAVTVYAVVDHNWWEDNGEHVDHYKIPWVTTSIEEAQNRCGGFDGDEEVIVVTTRLYGE